MVTSRPRIDLLCIAAAAVVALFAMTGTAAAATGNIEGKVVDAVTEAGIEEAEVCAFDAVEHEFCGLTGPDGKYLLSGLPEGIYGVEFWAAFLGYETRFYNESASIEDADPVDVFAPGTTTGIDAKLSKPAPHVDPLPPSTPSVPSPTPIAAPPALPAAVKPKPAPHCKKGFKRVKRNGHTVCAKKHKKKKHRS